MGILTNVELMTLALKQKLIGSSPYLKNEDGTDSIKEIADFETFMATDQFCLKFTDGETVLVMMREKFTVDVPSGMPRVNKGKIKKHKK